MRIWLVSSLSSTLALGTTCLQLLKLCHVLCRDSSITQGLEEVDGLKSFIFTFPSRVQPSFLSSPEITSNASQWAQCTRLGRSCDRFQPPPPPLPPLVAGYVFYSEEVFFIVHWYLHEGCINRNGIIISQVIAYA